MGATKQAYHVTSVVVEQRHALDLRHGIIDPDGHTVGYVYDESFAENLVGILNSHDALVEACKRVVTAAEIIDQCDVPTNEDIDHLHTSIAKARAALATAKKGT